MGTMISKYWWDGGSGYRDRQETIGFCVESPKEVLEKIILEYYVHSYKGFGPIDKHPAFTDGLVITEIKEDEYRGMTITGSLETLLPLMEKYKWSPYFNKDFSKKDIPTILLNNINKEKKSISEIQKPNIMTAKRLQVMDECKAVYDTIIKIPLEGK